MAHDPSLGAGRRSRLFVAPLFPPERARGNARKIVAGAFWIPGGVHDAAAHVSGRLVRITPGSLNSENFNPLTPERARGNSRKISKLRFSGLGNL